MNVFVYGASGQGRVTADLLRQIRRHKVVGFIDDDPVRKGAKIDGFAVLGNLDEALRKSRGTKGVVLAIGDGTNRSAVADKVVKRGLRLVGFIHPASMISPRAEVDPTAMIWPLAVVNAGARVGISSILNTSCVVEHDVRLGSFVHVAPNATICGQASVGDLTWVGAGSVILQEVSVGERVMIGAGAVVIRDVPAGVTGSGVPFRAHEA